MGAGWLDGWGCGILLRSEAIMSRLEVLGRREIADLFDSAVAGQIGL